MAFLKYSDVPVFANFIEEGVLFNDTHLFAASQFSASLNSNLSANRYLGKIQSRNDFSVVGPMEAKLSMTFYPIIETQEQNLLNISKNNQLAFFEATGDFNIGHNIVIGSYQFSRVYLENFSMKINAYQPISVTANFISYEMVNVTNFNLEKFSSTLPQIAKNDASPYYSALHGLSTTMDSSDNLPSTKTSIQVNVDCKRTPIYNLGSKTPSSVILTSVERTTTVDGESIGKAISLSGVNAGSTNIYFQPLNSDTSPSENNNILKFDINGKIVSQDISVTQQGFVNGKVVIKEIIL